MTINVNQIVAQRREAFSRLNPIKSEHRARARALWGVKDGTGAELKSIIEVKENIGVIPGFFPTPQPLASRMVSLSQPFPGCTFLEPSAGAGAIALEIRKAGYEPTCIEISYTLANRLRTLGFDTIEGDFLEHSEALDAIQYRYDRIIMNPPFEHGQDIDHVFHAWELLKPAGRIVAIMSNGTFYRQDRKATAFREWLAGRSWDERLPEYTFKSSGTGVETRLVVIGNV